jgi:hypothetical protein
MNYSPTITLLFSAHIFTIYQCPTTAVQDGNGASSLSSSSSSAREQVLVRAAKRKSNEHDNEVSLCAGRTGEIAEDAALELPMMTLLLVTKRLSESLKQRSEKTRLESPMG